MKSVLRAVCVALPLSFLLGSPAFSGCPDGQSQTSFGFCLPNAKGPGIDEAEHLKNELRGQVLGTPLEIWINQSHDSAIGNSQPMPVPMRVRLKGYIDDATMDRVRWKVGDSGIANLGGNLVDYGNVQAVTLNNLIIFRNDWDVMNNPGLWAHELTHVQQFHDWGTHDFAVRYARDYNQVEAPAYAKGDGYPAFENTHRMGQFCQTPYGRFGPFPPWNVGDPCSENTVWGLVQGQVVQ